MKMNSVFYLMILLALTLSCAENEISSPKKAVFIILDGIPADVIEGVSTPHLDAISNAGGYTRGYMGGKEGHLSESPTISAVGYNSLITGTWAHKHNVYGNSIKNPNYNYPSIFQIVEQADSSKQTAIFSTWLDNRTKLVGDGLDETGGIRIDYAFDGFEHDTLRFPHTEDRTFIRDIDEMVSKEAARYITEKGPDLSWVYLEFTDDMGHKFGDSKQMEEAVILADLQVGRIWEAIQSRENEDWMILITTDHGRKAEGGFGHGGHSERERTIWFVTNAKTLNQRFSDTPAMVDGIPSLLRFMEIEPLRTDLMESDGVPFIGPISIANASAEQKKDQIVIEWKAYEEDVDVDILISTTNNFASGKPDTYSPIQTIKASAGTFSFDSKPYLGDTLKILLRSETNAINTWIRVQPNQP